MCSSLARASPPHPETPFPVQRQTWREPIGQWLPLFHGRYVGLGYGTNDALGCADPATFYNNYVTMVKQFFVQEKFRLSKQLFGRQMRIFNVVLRHSMQRFTSYILITHRSFRVPIHGHTLKIIPTLLAVTVFTQMTRGRSTQTAMGKLQFR
jgi:hypothetical protein